MKTILEWLNEAKKQGYEWADAAIKNNKNPKAYTNSLSEALETAFVWADSPEKRKYWFKIDQGLRGGGL